MIGSSGSGKTTMARTIAQRLEVPMLELDGLFHQPDWHQKADDVFRSEVAEFAAGERWVVDGNSTSDGVAQLVWPSADTVVWIDLSRPIVMVRVVVRTLRRVVTREELWNGNREPWTNLYHTDPEKNIIVWAWTRHGPTRAKYEGFLNDRTWSHLSVVRLTTVAEMASFVEGLGQLSGNHDSS